MNVTRAVLPVMRKQRSATSSRSPRPPASSGRSSARPMPLRSSGSKDGWSRCGSRSSRSASNHDRRARLLPHRAAHEGVDNLRRAFDRRLRRAHRRDPSRLGSDERPADQRPREAREGSGHHRRRGAAAAALGCRRRRGRRPSSRRRTSCSRRSMPTATCRRRLRSTSRAERTGNQATERVL